MLGANYHLAPFVGFSLKLNDKIYVSRDVELLEEDNIKHILEDEKIKKNVFDLREQWLLHIVWAFTLTVLITTCFWHLLDQ